MLEKYFCHYWGNVKDYVAQIYRKYMVLERNNRTGGIWLKEVAQCD